MNAHQRRKERRALNVFWGRFPGLKAAHGFKGWPDHCAYKPDFSSLRQSIVNLEKALVRQCAVDAVRTATSTLTPFSLPVSYGKNGGLDRGIGKSVFGYSAAQVERMIAGVRGDGQPRKFRINGNLIELTRNKSCQVVVWIEHKRSSRANLFALINA